MKLKTLAIAALMPALGGCAEMATVMAMTADQMAAENGQYFEDDYDSMYFGDGDCQGWGEQGVSNNQGYARVTNRGSLAGTFKMTWSSGYETEFWLEPGQASDIQYMTPSLTVSSWSWDCPG
ncbi:MAG: hypothetical protein V4707_00180 [Pseudomonadota bacterium]